MKILDISIGTKSSWFRVLGYGLNIMYDPKRKPLFRERHGYSSGVNIWFIRLEILKGY